MQPRAFQTLQLARNRVAFAVERGPARIVDHAQPAAVVGETGVGIVLAQLQPVLGT